MFQQLRFPALVFFTASLSGLLLIYKAISGPGWLIAACALAYGLTLGLVAQLCVRKALPRPRVAIAAFAGALTLWLPVIAVTYGFALLAAPVLLAYSAAVILGVYAAPLLHSTFPSNKTT
jgi:hypothetical protein